MLVDCFRIGRRGNEVQKGVPSVTNPRAFLVTITGEPYQPTRLHYNLFERAKVADTFHEAAMHGLRQIQAALGLAVFQRSEEAEIRQLLLLDTLEKAADCFGLFLFHGTRPHVPQPQLVR